MPNLTRTPTFNIRRESIMREASDDQNTIVLGLDGNSCVSWDDICRPTYLLLSAFHGISLTALSSLMTGDKRINRH